MWLRGQASLHEHALATRVECKENAEPVIPESETVLGGGGEGGGGAGVAAVIVLDLVIEGGGGEGGGDGGGTVC